MEFRVEERGGTLIMSPRVSRIDVGNAQDFKGLVGKMLKEKGAKSLLLDLGEVEFMDSTALGAIVAIFKGIKSEGGELRICGLSELVKELFEITKLNSIIPLYESRESALQGAREGQE